jgi:hypothetical protein
LQRLQTDDEQVLVELQEQFAGRLTFRSDSSRHVEFFSISNAQSGEVYYASPEH